MRVRWWNSATDRPSSVATGKWPFLLDCAWCLGSFFPSLLLGGSVCYFEWQVRRCGEPTFFNGQRNRSLELRSGQDHQRQGLPSGRRGVARTQSARRSWCYRRHSLPSGLTCSFFYFGIHLVSRPLGTSFADWFVHSFYFLVLRVQVLGKWLKKYWTW